MISASRLDGGVVQFPLHAEPGRHRREAAVQGVVGQRRPGHRLDVHAHEEATGDAVPELLAVEHVAARLVQVGRDRVHDPCPVRAGQGEDVLAAGLAACGGGGHHAPTAWTPPSTWTISPVVAGNQSESSATQARAVGSGSAMSQPSGARLVPHALEPLEARDGLRGHGAQRAGRHQVHPDAVPPRSRARYRAAGLEPGLGHAHPVVARPGDARVEVQADHGTAAAHQRQRRHRAAPSASTPTPAPRSPRRATWCCTKFPPSASSGFAYAIACSTPSRPSTCSDTRPASEAEVLVAGHVQLEHRRRRGQPLGDPLHQAEPPEAGQHDGRALLLRHPRHVERDRGVRDDPGDQDPLARQDSHPSLTPMVISTFTVPQAGAVS